MIVADLSMGKSYNKMLVDERHQSDQVKDWCIFGAVLEILSLIQPKPVSTSINSKYFTLTTDLHDLLHHFIRLGKQFIVQYSRIKKIVASYGFIRYILGLDPTVSSWSNLYSSFKLPLN